MQWIKGFFYKYVFLLQNNQNRQQNKLVNMVNGNDLIKHNYWSYLYLTYVLWTQMCINGWGFSLLLYGISTGILPFDVASTCFSK